MPQYPFSLKHLLTLTDKVGIVEHCKYSQPLLSEGYSIDDNARSLQIALRLQPNPLTDSLIPIYFDFIKSAQTPKGFHNDLENGIWRNSDDIPHEHFGRTMTALAQSSLESKDASIKSQSLEIFQKHLSVIPRTTFPRTQSQLISAFHFISQLSGHQYDYTDTINSLAQNLVSMYRTNSSPNWHWFETVMTYENARLPIGLFHAFQLTQNQQYLHLGLKTLDFLLTTIYNHDLDCFSFPGNRGWYTRSGHRAIFDQQPIEAGGTVQAATLAYQLTSDPKYRRYAIDAFEWFLGKNIIRKSLYDPSTGGIYDGIEKDGVNQNQGAESLLSYLSAYLDLQPIP